MATRVAKKKNSAQGLPSVTFFPLINSSPGASALGACIIKLKAKIYTPVPEQRL